MSEDAAAAVRSLSHPLPWRAADGIVYDAAGVALARCHGEWAVRIAETVALVEHLESELGQLRRALGGAVAGDPTP